MMCIYSFIFLKSCLLFPQQLCFLTNVTSTGETSDFVGDYFPLRINTRLVL